MKITNNIEIFGQDADNFMLLSCSEKKAWIKDNTEVKDDEQIDQIVKNLNRGKDECDDCKKSKQKPISVKPNSKQARKNDPEKDEE